MCTLTAASELLAAGELTRVLVIAPLKVADNVWKGEHLKWSHLKHLSVEIATGDAKKREAAFASGSDIVVINIENVPWFVDTFKDGHGCDGLVIDELSKFKSNSSKGVKKLRRRLKPFKWCVGLTGTPCSEDWIGLYSQTLVLDGGARFGTNHQNFLERYFYPTDYMRRNWALRDGSAEKILTVMGDLVYVVPDYRHELPPITFRTVKVEMPEDARAVYTTLKKDMLVSIEGADVVASNAAVLSGKLTQAASGFLYVDDEYVEILHTAKLDAVKEIIANADGPVLLAYWFQHDRDELQALLGCPVYGTESSAKTNKLEADWNAGLVPVMMVHPSSCGHGLNLQDGGHTVVWYSVCWSRDLWEQLNGRLHRKGQTKPVEIISIEVADTIDQVISARVEDKAQYDRLLHKHLAS